MSCPGCGFESPYGSASCEHCGRTLVASGAVPGAPPADPADALRGLRFEPDGADSGRGVPLRRRRATGGTRVEHGGEFVEMLDDDAIEIEEEDFDSALPARLGEAEDGDVPLFRIDDDLFPGLGPGTPQLSGPAAGSVDWAPHREDWPEFGAERSGPAFVLAGEERGAPADVEPIIDRDDEVPERFWAPEIAGLERRALAFLVDHVLVLGVLGLFFLGALVALQSNGLTADLLLTADGLQASALPFSLLAALLSLAYSSFFHGVTGRTPGKALAGVEVRTSAGGAVTWGRVLLRWIGAALGLLCAGVGVVWALFEPRRRGWADLISGTVIARPQREPALESSRR